jgi:hypothetical protein
MNKIQELIKKAEDKVNSTMLSNIRKTEINLILLEIQKEAINYTHCCTELPTIEEIIVSEIRRKHQKQVDDEVERFLSGNGTDCRLRGFFSEPDINE